MLHDICDIQLLYMGNSIFAELKQKPYSITPAQAFATDPLAQISAMKHSADPAVPMPVNISRKHASSTVSHAMESTPTSETPTIGTNVASNQTQPSTSGSNKDEETDTVPNYGAPVFPMAIQILPLHPHFFSDDDDDTTEDTSIDETSSISSENTTVENTAVTKALPDIINRDCRITLPRLTEDEISIWSKEKAPPEFPQFIDTTDIGGYSMRKRSDTPVKRHNTRPLRATAKEINYDGMDDENYNQPPKPKRRKANIAPQSGPSASHMAACEYYLRSDKSHQTKGDTNKTPITPTPPTPILWKVLTDNTETETASTSKAKLVVTTHGMAAMTTSCVEVQMPGLWCGWVKQKAP